MVFLFFSHPESKKSVCPLQTPKGQNPRGFILVLVLVVYLGYSGEAICGVAKIVQPVSSMPAWRNGRRSRLKIYRTQVCVSSSLTAGSNVSLYVVMNYERDYPTEGVHNLL